MARPTRFVCDRCDRILPHEAHYLVRIDVVADPSPPRVSSEELEETDFDTTLSQLLDEMKDIPTEELEDGVAKHFEFRICRSCQRDLLRNPLGRSGDEQAG